MKKRESYQQMVLGKLDITSKLMKLDTYLAPYKKISSKCIKDIILWHKIIKFLEENRGLNLCDIDLFNDFLDLALKSTSNYLQAKLHQTEKFLHSIIYSSQDTEASSVHQ